MLEQIRGKMNLVKCSKVSLTLLSRRLKDKLEKLRRLELRVTVRVSLLEIIIG